MARSTTPREQELTPDEWVRVRAALEIFMEAFEDEEPTDPGARDAQAT